MQKNYYLLLGINKYANAAEIKTAYRTLAKKYHPDKNVGNKAAEDYFKEIQEAYSVLSDPGKRKKYDLSFALGTQYNPATAPPKQKHYTPYAGNAYQYAQQQAQYQQRPFTERKQEEEKPDKTERNQLLLCVVIALILLYFIVSYSFHQTLPLK